MNIWKLCRTCLTAKESFSYYLFKNISVETFWFCTSIQVADNDDLPKTVCDECYTLLIKYYEFKQTCIESQRTLLSCKNVKFDIATSSALSDDSCSRISEIDDRNYEEPKFVISKLNDVKQEELSENHNQDFLSTDRDTNNILEKQTLNEKEVILKSTKLKRKATSKEKKPPKISCEVCSKKFRHLERFKAHQLEHEDKSVSLHCTPCNKTFMTSGGLSRHRENAHASIPLSSVSCASCGRVCASRHSLKAHQRMHQPRATCVCHVCGKRVSTAVILKTHLETHKIDRERLHTCEHCGKKFYTNTMLLSHIGRQHTGRRYICDYCRYPFTDKYNLAKHIRIHQGKKPYSCDICHKSFATNGSLVEHKRLHSGERPFGCKYCPKRFLSKRRLTDHHRIHTGEKPHKCSVCEQRFTQRGTLQRHMKIHEKSGTVAQ